MPHAKKETGDNSYLGRKCRYANINWNMAANYEDDDEQGKMIKYSYTSDESLYKNYDLKQ